MRIWGMLEQLHIAERLWQMSLLACMLIFFVLLLRLLLRKCSRGYSYGLWLLVLLRLLCPVLIESEYSMQPLALTGESVREPDQQIPGQYFKGRQTRKTAGTLQGAELSAEGSAGSGMGWQGYPGTGGNGVDETGIPGNGADAHRRSDRSFQSAGQSTVPTGGKAFGSVYGARTADVGISLPKRIWRSWVPVLKGIYVSGAAVLLLYFAALYISWKRKLSAAVRQRENIWYSERIFSPFVLGVLRPRIYLPYGLDPQEESYILLHEKKHIRHLDPLLRLMGTLALCLHWWNPLVWLGICCFYQDMEMFCDEAAMGGQDLSCRRAYAETLLHFAVKQSGPGMALAFGEPHTEQRIRNILGSKRRERWITPTVALAAVAGAVIFLTVPQGSRAEAEDHTDLSDQGGFFTGELEGQGGFLAGETESQGGFLTGELEGQGGFSAGELQNQAGISGAGGTEQPGLVENSQTQQGQGSESYQNLVLSQCQISPAQGQSFDLQLVMTKGVYYTREQALQSLFAENYEGKYQLRVLDPQGQILDAVDLVNGQGGEVMNFPCRDFPWYFEDYNLDGQQDFFLGTKAADDRSYHYLMTVTEKGEIGYLYDGPMWEGHWPMEAENITNLFLESGGDGSRDNRIFFLYQDNEEYSSHDFYTWSPSFEKYRKSVVFTYIGPWGQDREAQEYLEGTWRVAGVDMWNQEQPRPDIRIGEVLAYENGNFRQLNQAKDMVYEQAVTGSSCLLQSREEFWDSYSMLFPDDGEEPIRRILINAGETCRFGNAVYAVNENEMLVYDLADPGTFWTAVREDLRGEAGQAQEYLQGTWEIRRIASRPYESLEQEEAEAFLGTKLTYDWHNTAEEFTMEGTYHFSVPVLGFGQRADNSADWPPEAELPEGELLWQSVNLGEGEFFGVDLLKMDENRVWIYYMGTFFEAERVG